MSRIEQLAAQLPEGEVLSIIEYLHETKEWAVCTSAWDPKAENVNTALDYLRGTESPKGNWIVKRRAVGETPEIAVQKLVSGEENV